MPGPARHDPFRGFNFRVEIDGIAAAAFAECTGIGSETDGQVSRRTVAITLLDGTGAPVMRWTLRDAWPVKLEGPSLNARGNDVALETIELAHEGLHLE